MPAARSAQLHLQRFVYVRLKVLRRFHRRVYFFDDGGCTAGWAFVAVISFVIWFVLQPSTFATIPWSSTIIASLFIHAYFIVAFAQTLNIFAQRRATATESTIIYSLEIVFSLIWGAVLPENLVDRAIPTPFHIIGAVLIVAGSLVEIIEFKGKRRLKNVSEKQ